MGSTPRRLWFGDWETTPTPAPAPESKPTRVVVQSRRQERRTRAWLLTGALGAATFAWSFGYILGEVRAGTDPGLRAAATTNASQRAPSQPADQFSQPGDESQGQSVPPLTTRQS